MDHDQPCRADPRKSSFLDLDTCLCHKDGIQGGLSPFSLISWHTFRNAAEIRNDGLFAKLGDLWDSGPHGGYHRTCYQRYTMKKHLKRIQLKRENESEIPAGSDSPCTSATKRVCIRRSNFPLPKITSCILCQEEKGDKIDRRKIEPLVQCQTFEAGSTLLRAAEVRGDERVVILLKNTDVIAAEIRYHKTCYRNYTRSKSLQSTQFTDDVKPEQYAGYDNAFSILASEIRSRVIESTEILSMTYLRDRYISLLQEEGINSPNYKTYKVKDRIINCFSDEVAFWCPKYRAQSEIVYSNMLPKGLLVEESLNQSMTCSNNTGNDNEVLEQPIINYSYHSAKHLRKCLFDHRKSFQWPPTADEIRDNAITLPDDMFNFLAWLLTDATDIPNVGRVPVKASIDTLILSLGQDLLYNTTHGNVKTPKHISLAVAVKSLTGSKQIVTLLNKFGHCISNSSLCTFETAMAERQTVMQSLVPTNIQSGSFATFVWDNNDILEETLSGAGTTHCTNGIAIQRSVDTCMPCPAPEREGFVFSGKRSFQPEPQILLPYITGKRPFGPPIVENREKHDADVDAYQSPLKYDFAWSILRLETPNTTDSVCANTHQSVPGWSAFNANVLDSDAVPRSCNVGYCQVIEAPPTELPVVYNILKRSLSMADELGQIDVVVVFDQAIYAKALEIIWKDPIIFQRIVPCMGAFHTACTFLAVLGKRFGDAGLRDILIESNLIGSGSVNAVLDGRQYNRGLRMHKLVLEAMLRLRWCSFVQSLSDADKDRLWGNEILSSHSTLQTAFTPIAFKQFLESEEFIQLYATYQSFCQSMTQPMAVFWNTYIQMVELLLCFIRSTREGNWALHIQCIGDMIPWMFAYDRLNYAKYMPIYHNEMLNLKTNHYEAYESLSGGEFAVQRASRPFAQVPRDQAIEQTLNRATKTHGGIIGFSCNTAAVHRWVITAHERASIKDRCFAMAGLIESRAEDHKESSSTRLNKDEQEVIKVAELVVSLHNPFTSHSEDLQSISSGIIADQGVSLDLAHAERKGREAANAFIQDRIHSNNTSFYDPLKKINLKTFSSLNNKKSVSFGTKTQILKADRNLFSRMIVVAQSRCLDLRLVLQHCLGPIPWPLAEIDGSFIKTSKAKLAELIQADIPPYDDTPLGPVWIIDLMALLHGLSDIPNTFSELSVVVLQRALQHTDNDARVDIVADQYPLISIKNVERSRRASDGTLLINISSGTQKVPKQWKKYLSSGANKMALVEFVYEEWVKPQYVAILGRRSVYFAHSTLCHMYNVENNSVVRQEVAELISTQEEADYRMLLHVKHAAAAGNELVIIRTPDTDVQVLACYFQQQLPRCQILVHCGNRARSRLVDINSISLSLGPFVCEALPGLHAFTGSDCNSAFAGKGKKKSFELVQSRPDLCRSMQSLGKSVPITEECFLGIVTFTCALYGGHGDDIDELRFNTFCTKNPASNRLPPCSDALRKHAARANYQAYIWKSAFLGTATIPSPHGNGWILTNNVLFVDWMDKPPAPKAILELIKCSCTGDCSGARCTCFKNRMVCTECCGCSQTCINSMGFVSSDSESDG